MTQDFIWAEKLGDDQENFKMRSSTEKSDVITFFWRKWIWMIRSIHAVERLLCLTKALKVLLFIIIRVMRIKEELFFFPILNMNKLFHELLLSLPKAFTLTISLQEVQRDNEGGFKAQTTLLVFCFVFFLYLIITLRLSNSLC